MEEKRAKFSGKLGFVLVSAGSAVGLGNLWRFPYLAAKYGGGMFLLVYIILAVTFGFCLMVAEVGIGRKTGLSAMGAFKKLSSKWAFVGYLESLVPMIILPYYCVIGGWVIKYFFEFLTHGTALAAQPEFFGAFVGGTTEPILWFAIFLLATAVIVFMGVNSGIERVSKIFMPVLIVLAIGISVYSVTQPGAIEGVKYYLLPNFSQFSLTTVFAALGQLFYSMSLAMGIMVTYGSYMKKDVELDKSVHQIEIFDTGIAFLAGLMIIPSIFAFFPNNTNDMLQEGPALMFVTLPKVFDNMSFGALFGVLFFVLVFLAALTSSIAVMEAVVSAICDKWKLSRKKAVIVVLLISIVFGIPASLGNGVWSSIKILGMDFLSFFDFISNSVLMPIVAFCICIFVGYVIKPGAIIEEVELNRKFREKKFFSFFIKYIAPVCVAIIFVFSLLEALGVINV